MRSMNDPRERSRKVRRVLWGVLAANWAIACAKLWIGLLCNTAAVTADGVHAFIDGASNVIALVGVSIAARPADEDHPYGHGKFEALAALGIGMMVGMGMLELGKMAVGSLLHHEHAKVDAVTVGVMVAALVGNLAITTLERHFGKKLESGILLADSRHTLSDVVVTVAVLGSLGLIAIGFPMADGITALAVMGVVAWVAYEIIRQAVGILSDSARLDPLKVSEVVSEIPGVSRCGAVRSRGMEGTVWVDLKIEVDPELTTASAHAVADEVEARLGEAFPQVVDVVVHVEPSRERMSSLSAEGAPGGLPTA